MNAEMQMQVCMYSDMPKLLRQIVCYLAELFRQIAFPIL